MFVCSNSVIQCMLYILSIAKLLFMLFMFDYIILSTLNILLEVSKLEYFLNSKEHILRGRLWNQGLVNLGFDDNKTWFWTIDYISSVIMQDYFQSGNHKDKSNQWEIMKKKTTSKRSAFQDPNFIRSLCKVVGALGFSYITFFTYAPKSSKNYFVLNILRIG